MTPRRFLAKLLRRCAYEIDPSLFAEAAPATIPAALPPAPATGNFDPYQVPLRDTELSGWFNREKSELYPGITIGTQDVVADIGCGSGGHARFCAEHGAHVILADADPAQLASARALWADDDARVEAHVTRGDPLPIADGRCTRVICNEVIEHVDDPVAFLAELARIGASGSRYLISLPAPFGENVLKHIAHPSYFAPPNHVRIVEPEQLRRWITDAGLVIESYSTYGADWALWWWLFWCDPQPSLSPRHPVLDHLAHLWSALLDSQNGMLIKRALDHAIPKSQVIVARKP